MNRQLIDRLMNSVPGRAVNKFMQDQAPNWAALIAWNMMFSMFPIVLFAASILGFVLSLFGSANQSVYNLIFNAIPAGSQTQNDLLKAVTGVKSASGVFFVVGLVGTLWAASNLFGMMEQAFAVIYHTKQRDFIQQKLIAFAMVFLFTILVGVAVLTSSLLPLLKHIPHMPSFFYSGVATTIVQVLIGIVAGFIMFATAYYVIPNRKQEFPKVVPGAITGGVLFELLTLLFPLYLSLNKGINQYGSTFALIFVLMTFFFFFGIITMLGVEVNSVIFPVPLGQPGKEAQAVAPPQTGPEGERRRTAPRAPAIANGSGDGGARDGAPARDGRRGIPARAALGMAVIASAVGVILGRRTANGG